MVKLSDIASRDDDAPVTVGAALPRLASVSVLGGFRLLVKWDRGVRAGEAEEVDVAPAIFSHRALIDLRTDRALFERAEVIDHGAAIAWPGGSELPAEWVSRLPRAAMTNEEFRSIMDDRLHYTLDGMAHALGIARRRIADYRKATPVPVVVALAARQLVAQTMAGIVADATAVTIDLSTLSRSRQKAEKKSA